MKSLWFAAVAALFMGMAPVADAQEVIYEGMPAPVMAPAPLTVGQAVCALKELCPGKYEMCFIHPYTCCPVKVCFCLPCGCYDLKCKECFGTKLVFDYDGGPDVVIKFKKNGDVVVK